MPLIKILDVDLEILLFSIFVPFVIWQSSVTIAFGQPTISEDMTQKFDDSAFEIHNLYSSGILNSNANSSTISVNVGI